MAFTNERYKCPVCKGPMFTAEDGKVPEHKRYVAGGGPLPDQSHDMVPCEGVGQPIPKKADAD